MAVKAVKNFASLLTAEGSKPAEALQQLLFSGGQDMLTDLPITTIDAIISTGLDPTATATVRTLSYQIINSGQATTYSEKFLDRLLPCVTLDLSNEDKELGLLALSALFAVIKDTQLVPLFRDTTFLDAIKAGMTNNESVLMRQTITEVVGRALPRLMARLELPTVMSGTFPSMVDAQRFRQEARDAASDLVKKLWEGCEDADDGVSGSSFLALEEVLLTGSPRLLRSELATFFNQPDKSPPTATLQELTTSYVKMGIARLPRLLLRFTSLRRSLRRGAIATLSHLLFYLLLDSTNMHGIYLPPPGDKTVINAIPSAALRWSSSPNASVKQIASEWLHLHLVPIAQGTEPSEALAAATWGIELLHISALRPYRKNLAYTFMEALLRLPTLTQLRHVRPFARPLNDSQAATVVYTVSALKWLSLSSYESIVPRLLQVIRWIDSDSCRASCLGEVVSLALCDVQRNGRVQDSWVIKTLLSDEWVTQSMAEEGAQFREEFLTAIILSLLKLAPIVFLPIGLQVKLGNLLEKRITHDLSYYSRISSVTRITRKAISRPAVMAQLSRSSSDAVQEPFWLQNCGRWIGITLYCLQKASSCANWTSSSSAYYSTFSIYLTLLSLACAVLLSPMRDRLELRPEEMDEFREALKAVLLDLLSFKLPEGVTNRPLRLKVLRILAHYVGSMGNDQEAREQAAAEIIRFLDDELTNQETVGKWKEDMASRKYRGLLGGGKVTEAPSMAESLSRARVAMRCLQQVAITVKSAAPQVLAVLERSISSIDQSTSADFFRDEVKTTMATIKSCLGPTGTTPSSKNTPTSTDTGKDWRASPMPTGGGPTPGDLTNNHSQRSSSSPLEEVMLVEPVLLPNMEADGRVIYRHDRNYQYWMKVFTALSIRLNRLIKTVQATGPDERVSASSLFKRINASVATAVTGGSDPIHLILDHHIPPNSNQLTITARAFNATNCKIDRLQLQLIIQNSRQARVGAGQRNVVDFSANLEPGGCFEASFQVDVIRFGDVQVAMDVIFPGMELEVEVEGEDLDEEHDEREEEEAGHRAEVVESGGPDGMGGEGPQPARNVTLRSAPLTIPFINFLCPALEYELLLPSFQDIWSCLPFTHSFPVETDPSTIRGVQTWLASQASSKPSSPTPRSGQDGDDIIRMMEAAPLYGNELLGGDRHAVSLREQARVTNKIRRVPFVAGSFFSEAWLFRTWSSHTLAAVLTGTGQPGLQWRGRLEIRCNDQETFECVMDPGALRRFTSFLTNNIFHIGGSS